MLQSFKEFSKQIDEALITFGKKAYPKFGQVVILAGGAGSGKGFTLSNLLGIEGKVFDVDALKELAMKSTVFSKRVKDEIGRDITKMNLKDPKEVADLHVILSDVYGLTKNHKNSAYSSILLVDPRRKPNLIFDVTLANMKKLEDVSRDVQQMGYKKEDIHVVWVMNDVKIAMKQNLERDRVVPDNILMGTHKGAAISMSKIISDSEYTQQHMNGDIWIAFNKRGVDSEIVFSSQKGGLKGDKSGGSYILKSNIIKIKEKGKKAKSRDDLPTEMFKKIKDYAPKSVDF
ncbi:hypothetical protein VmeM32_00027 [Vibrio phage vB_VmeM-32]|nr:hypothetical protein VmeM32_00027 [Vibrio phage vB_VmeM-32]